MREFFAQALPVWIKGKEREMNVTAGFLCTFDRKRGCDYRLQLTGSSLYRIYLNGKFVHHGPARGPHGFARIDSLQLSDALVDGVNLLAIEVAGYNCNSFYTLNMPSFLQAELYEDGSIIGHTDVQGDFAATHLTYKVQKTMRYSFQRTFTEIYHLDHADRQSKWATGEAHNVAELAIIQLPLQYLPREVPIPRYQVKHTQFILETGSAVEKADNGGNYAEHRFIHHISDTISGYRLEEIKERPFEVVQDLTFKPETQLQNYIQSGAVKVQLHAGQYALFDLGMNNTGFILADILARQDSEVYFVFDEKRIDGRFDIDSWTWINVLKYSLKQSAQSYSLESFECYGFRYILCYVSKGSIQLEYLGLREYSYPHYQNTVFQSKDDKLNRIFEAAMETYRQNTLDLFMDCPTRERAGWLCDSYFTAQAAQFFSGDSAAVEKVFLENFVRAKQFRNIPSGMLPMCYPADTVNGRFIPQWAMWYVIELEGYSQRNDKADLHDFKEICYGLVDYFKPFQNEDGLLERLDSWNFIEWSAANQWVQDVSYPTNMLYSKMLRLIGKWFDDPALAFEAEQIKAHIIRQSFNGVFFVDNAVRTADGKLEPTNNTSEVCQYYAFFCEVATETDDRFKQLKYQLLHSFGPSRRAQGLYPDVAHANAFIGYYLRMELLLRWRKYIQALDEVKRYFYPMCELTGTLWEHDSVQGSLNHGFASFAGVVIVKALLGVQHIHESEKTITLDFGAIPIEAEAAIGIGQGEIYVKRWCNDGDWEVEYTVPDGYEILNMRG